MPFEMSNYIQSVVVQGTVYVGGGWATSDNDDYIIMEYDSRSGKWSRLPPYTLCYFAMTVINNQLVVVGGVGKQERMSKLLGVWKTDSKKWIHPYPDMLTARSNASAVTYNKWLIVAGGRSGYDTRISTVEVMNIDTKQWYARTSAPKAFTHMKTAIVGGLWYLMGGYDEKQKITDKVYSVSLPVLISQVNSTQRDPQIWKCISGLGLYSSTPLSISGSLLALGGEIIDKAEYVTTIHHYQPETGEWVKVGDLPSPRSECTCTVMNNGEVLVAGGYSGGWNPMKSAELMSLMK